MIGRSRGGWAAGILAGIVLLGVSAGTAAAAKPVRSTTAATTTTMTTSGSWTIARLTAPPRTVVRTEAGSFVAELTDGTRTVQVAGPSRTWTEPGVVASVTTDRWVRLLPVPFDGTFDSADGAWLSAALSDRSPDVLATAFRFVAGAPDSVVDGVRVAGDAHYGATAGADFNDYLGLAWRYGTKVDAPESNEYGAVDCSGYVRLVLGYHLGLPLVLSPAGGALPRRAADQFAAGPGRVTVANSGRQVTSFTSLRPGDLLFFDASTTDGTAIDHVGIYLGRDSVGHQRFVSSRRTADGPTMGDVAGASILDGTGYWARAFRGVRRP